MEILSLYKDDIDEELGRVFKDFAQNIPVPLSDINKKTLDILQEFSLRQGKRMRGSLAAYCYEYACGGKSDKDTAIKLAVALELIQNYLLIIDDVMDRSLIRRDKPTVHVIYESAYSVLQDKHHISQMLAINAGNLVQHIANLVILSCQVEPNTLTSVLNFMHKNISYTGMGQIDDLTQLLGSKTTEEELINKYKLKSSYYTFINPIQLGLIMAGEENENVLGEVRAIGELAGIAFQLKDDYLGVFGEDKITGKSNVDDLKEGKYTLVVHHAYAHSNNKEKEQLSRHLGDNNLSNESAMIVKNIFKKYESDKYIEQKSSEYANLALQELAKTTYWDTDSKQSLKNLIEFSVSRSK